MTWTVPLPWRSSWSLPHRLALLLPQPLPGRFAAQPAPTRLWLDTIGFVPDGCHLQACDLCSLQRGELAHSLVSETVTDTQGVFFNLHVRVRLDQIPNSSWPISKGSDVRGRCEPSGSSGRFLGALLIEQRRLRAGMHFQFPINLREVVADGLGLQLQGMGDFLVRLARGHLGKDALLLF